MLVGLATKRRETQEILAIRCRIIRWFSRRIGNQQEIEVMNGLVAENMLHTGKNELFCLAG